MIISRASNVKFNIYIKFTVSLINLTAVFLDCGETRSDSLLEGNSATHLAIMTLIYESILSVFALKFFCTILICYLLNFRLPLYTHNFLNKQSIIRTTACYNFEHTKVGPTFNKTTLKQLHTFNFM